MRKAFSSHSKLSNVIENITVHRIIEYPELEGLPCINVGDSPLHCCELGIKTFNFLKVLNMCVYISIYNVMLRFPMFLTVTLLLLLTCNGDNWCQFTVWACLTSCQPDVSPDFELLL